MLRILKQAQNLSSLFALKHVHDKKRAWDGGNYVIQGW
jgi:hypothetical protein